MKRLRRDGSALVMVLSMTAIGVILCSGIMTYAVNNARLAQREELIERALHVAEAGLEWAAQYIVDRDAYLFVNSTPIEGTINQGSFQGVIQKEGFRTYSISCTGTVQGVSRAVTIDEVYVATFAKFGWWSEVNGDIWFIPGDNLFGHVHTDDYLKFSTTSGAGPVFDGNPTSRKNRYTLRKNGYDRTEYTRPPAESAGVEFNAGFDLSSPQGNMADVNWSTKKRWPRIRFMRTGCTWRDIPRLRSLATRSRCTIRAARLTASGFRSGRSNWFMSPITAAAIGAR